jgi:ankyrin repeat protein
LLPVFFCFLFFFETLVKNKFLLLKEHDGSTELIMAASTGNLERVTQLLKEGAHPDQRDAEGCSALHWAADRGHSKIIAQLLESKADINAVDGDGLTPLHYAALTEQKEAALVLIAGGSDPLRKNNEGETAADLAPSDWESSVFNKVVT